jgi:pimeloyl-ACP methyl ester carboxylesterase
MSPTVTSADGTSIAYELIGNGPLLILIDAASGFREFGPMRPLARALSGSFTVCAYDRRGRGESGNTLPYAVEREVEDFDSLVTSLGGEAHLYGFSSGAVLALRAARDVESVIKLVLMEPPIGVQGAGSDPNIAKEIADLVEQDRREDAIVRFHESIGVPEEIIDDSKGTPAWKTLIEIAHTLPYDFDVSESISQSDLEQIDTPTLVIDSTSSSDDLREAADAVSQALPYGSRRSVDGEWHGADPEVLAPVIAEFLLDS